MMFGMGDGTVDISQSPWLNGGSQSPAGEVIGSTPPPALLGGSLTAPAPDLNEQQPTAPMGPTPLPTPAAPSTQTGLDWLILAGSAFIGLLIITQPASGGRRRR